MKSNRRVVVVIILFALTMLAMPLLGAPESGGAPGAPAAAADAGGHGVDLAEGTELFSVAALIALLTLTALEVVLGIDNVIFIAIIAGRLPAEQRNKARMTGIIAAVVTRILLLFSISWLMSLTKPVWEGGPWILGDLSGKDLILLIGGLFLVGKSVFELHEKLEVPEGHGHGAAAAKAGVSFMSVIIQIMLIDIVFSLDSVITAVGMVPADLIAIMVAAVVIAAIVMVVFQRPIANFVERHPTMKVLALAFLILIGFMLMIEAFEYHVPKGYIYFAMFFSLCVEFFNMALRRRSEKLRLHYSTLPKDEPTAP